MRKVFYLVLLVFLFAGCGGNGNENGSESCENDSVGIDTLEDFEYVDNPEGFQMFKDGTVFVSEDGRVSIESGICPGGGTAYECWAIWTIKDSKGKSHELRYEVFPGVRYVHDIHKKDGTVYYIVECTLKSCSWEMEEWIAAYRIVGDTIEQVSVMNGGKWVEENDFGIAYSVPEWYFAANNGEGYDWIYEYDAKTRNLYVPLVSDYCITDRYEVWHFDGERFVSLGEKPHKKLHEELGDYNRLIWQMETKDYIVRVDSLNSRELRYASWKKPKTTADKPDVVIKGGVRQVHPVAGDELPINDDYHFKTGSYEYVVDYEEHERKGEGRGIGHEFLVVKKNGKVVMKQERVK